MSIFGKLIGTVIDVATLPIAVVKDVATMGRAVTDQEEPYTIKKIKDICDDLSKVDEDLRGLRYEKT